MLRNPDLWTVTSITGQYVLESPPDAWDGTNYSDFLTDTAMYASATSGGRIQGEFHVDNTSNPPRLIIAIRVAAPGNRQDGFNEILYSGDGVGPHHVDIEVPAAPGTWVVIGVSDTWSNPSTGLDRYGYIESIILPPPPPPEPYKILFEPIPPEAHSGSGSRPLALTPAALGFELLVGQGFGARPLSLRAFGEAYDFVRDFEPSIPANGFLALALSPYAEGYVVGGGSGQRPLTIAARAFSSSAGGAHPTILITSSGYDSAPVFGHAFLEDRMPEMSAYGGAWFIEAGASMTLNDDPFADYMVAVADVLRLTDAPLVLASFLRTVQSSITLRDFAVAVFEREVLADIALDDEADAVLDLIVQVTAQLMLDDEGASLLSTLHTVVGALALRDSVRLVMQGEVPSEIELADLASARLQALVEAAAELYLDESIEHSLALFSLVDSPLELGEDALHSISALVEALSGLDFGVRIRIGDELFVGYAMNVRNTAVSEYENFPFNSMAVIGGVPYGAGPDGIYRLQGDDDDGAPIDARVRTAALTFGHLARVPYARIVFTSDGDLLFRTITMDKGARKENTYKMAKRPLGTAVESRFTMAKGVTSSVWAFELSNVDGAYFEADALQVWTLQLDRRYSGR